MDEQQIKKELERDLYLQAFESTQKYIKEKRDKLAQEYHHRGLYQSGPHAKAVIDLELEGLKRLLSSYFDILKRVYFKTKDLDEKFLRTKIEELYHARNRASKKSLSDYLPLLRAVEPLINAFERGAVAILSQVLRDVRIAVSEGLLESKKIEAEEQHKEALMTMNEKREQFLLKLNELSEGDISKFIDTMSIGDALNFDRATAFSCARYFDQKGYIEPRDDAYGTISITAAGIDEADRIQSKMAAPPSDQGDLPEEKYFPPQSHLDIQKNIAKVLRQAKTSLWICDPYMDEKIVEEITNTQAPEIRLLTTYTKGPFKQRLAAAKEQFPERKIEAKICDKCHDRFYIIDQLYIWTLGASLNEAGKKATFLSNVENEIAKEKLLHDFIDWWTFATEIKI